MTADLYLVKWAQFKTLLRFLVRKALSGVISKSWVSGSHLISSSKALMQIWACFIAEIFMHCFHRSLFPQLFYPTMQRPIVSFQVFCPLISLKVYLDALNWSLLLLSLYIYHLEEEFVRSSSPQRHTSGGEAGRVRGGETVRRLEQKRERETVKVEEEDRRSADHLKGLKNVSGFITPAVFSLLYVLEDLKNAAKY